jgi:hypothetical protein
MTDDVTPAQLRAQAEEKVRPLGQRRIRLLTELEAVEAELRPAVRDAVRVEVSQRKLSTMTALSTTTIAKWGRGE